MIDITEHTQCFGCTACQQICHAQAISMTADTEGFLYPSVDKQKCLDCGLCEKVCPALQESNTNKSTEQHIYALRHRDPSILKKSASGGAFSVFAQQILEHKGVVFGVAYQNHMIARHISVESVEDLSSLHDSKYVQSYLGDTFSTIGKHLKDGREVMFVGTPCQVAGLKNYLRKPYQNLLTCDLLCHSVASPMIFAKYIDFVERKTGKKVINLSLRDKSKGWGVLSSRMEFADGSCLKDSYWASTWVSAYNSMLVTRPSCHNCPFCSFERCGDISIGDFWGIKKSHPEFYNAAGVSILMVNTAQGQAYFNQVKERCDFIESNRTKAVQPVLVAPQQVSALRKAFWHDYTQGGIDKVMRKYWGYTFSRRLKLWAMPLYNILKNRK
ncbi:MAG: Coenzyme F420 hydrogenase/dehydrogenase, beta subunit C-terminal domain [Bacteroidaceae bacterium]|nr:Coenzyme F420 hydrogenase/dehydrogenase, beta subunit C-terminal domain [Bacteroidaceae bacterium]